MKEIFNTVANMLDRLRGTLPKSFFMRIMTLNPPHHQNDKALIKLFL